MSLVGFRFNLKYVTFHSIQIISVELELIMKKISTIPL